VQLQQAQLQKRIKVWEAVDLWASLYPKPLDGSRLLEQLGLSDKRLPATLEDVFLMLTGHSIRD
jgi:ABC-type multidrug transport system ATPase subunit